MTMLGALVLTMWVEYTGEADDIGSHLGVVGLHIVIAGSIVLWSFAAMYNANKFVPPSLYQRQSNPLPSSWCGCRSAITPVRPCGSVHLIEGCSVGSSLRCWPRSAASQSPPLDFKTTWHPTSRELISARVALDFVPERIQRDEVGGLEVDGSRSG
jgi:hypothetical protein